MSDIRSIWKYELDEITCQIVEMPIGADILTVQVQKNTTCLWARVDPDEDGREGRCIKIHGTGHGVPDSDARLEVYINTFQLMGGDLVSHAFESIE